MKSHIPPRHRLSKSARQAIKEFDDELKAETFRRWLKLSCVVLHIQFGFGHDRCTDFLGEVSKLAGEEQQDEIFWRHIDRVMQELQLDFVPEKYENLERADKCECI